MYHCLLMTMSLSLFTRVVLDACSVGVGVPTVIGRLCVCVQAYKLGYASADAVPSFVYFLNNCGSFDALDTAVASLSREFHSEEKDRDEGDDGAEPSTRDVIVYGGAIEALHAIAVCAD
jgi:hypothetical protein